MLTIVPRRFLRRPILIAFTISAVLIVLVYSNYPHYVPVKTTTTTTTTTTIDHPTSAAVTRKAKAQTGPTVLVNTVTVTKIRTAWARTTRTVLADGSDPTAVPPTVNNANEGGGVRADSTLHRQLGEHIYRPDGLLQVNPDGPHPIYGLVRRAEQEWEAKLNRASKTLEEAVREYKRRYKRPPPLGFDAWWAYVERHNVQLPDEYDQIYNDLEPYWGMNPEDLQDIEYGWEAHRDSYTIGKRTADEKIQILNYSLPPQEDMRTGLARVAFEIMELVEEVEDVIPPFRAVFSPHDNPNLPTDWELKQIALKAASEGRFIDINAPPKVKLNGWIAGCDPEAPAWRDPIHWGHSPPLPTLKTFIHDHRAAMDPCQHPDHFLLHGQYISHHTGPVPHRTMVPQFSYGPTPMHHDIMVAIPINWIEDISRADDPEFEDKPDERLQWRGSNTGIWHSSETRWWDAQRVRLIRWADTVEGKMPVPKPNEDGDDVYYYGDNFTVLESWMGEGVRVGEGKVVKRGRYAPAMLDVAFAGAPLSCPPEMCGVLTSLFEYRKPHSIRTQGNYKYILDVDGNGWSSRFKRLITSNSLIFKSTAYPEWFTERIAPWVHYVPVQLDLSDLYDALQFFRGDPNGRGAHEEMAAKMAKAGRDWSLKFWRKEDLTAYNFRLFLEYARVMNPQRLKMNYPPEGS